MHLRSAVLVLSCALLATPARAAVEIATLDTPGSVRDFVLDGAIGYVADATGGIRVIDVANPLAPVEIASLPPAQLGNVQAVYLDGDRLYSAESSGGVSVIDVANPATPVRLGRVTGMAQVLDVVAAGDHAFAISNVGPGFYVIDASAPATPVVVASLGATGTSIRWHSPGRVVAGTRLIDVSDPLVPSIVAESFVYPTAIGDGFGISTGLRRYDLADPVNPVVVNQAVAPDASYSAAVIDAELAWLVGSSGIGLYELSDAQPTYPFLGSIEFPSLHFVNRLRVVGTRLYATVSGTGATGLYVYDVADPAAPVQLGYFAAGDLGDLDVVGDVAYAVDRSFLDDGVAGLYAIDVSDPAAMEQLALTPFEGGDLVSASGDRVYVIDNDFTNASTLRVFDVADPASPTEIGSLAGFGVVDGIESSGSQVQLVTSQWFQIYDATTPSAIALVGEYWSSGVKRGLAVAGTRAWVTSDQLEAIDFTLPFAPTLVSSFDLPGPVPGTEFRNPLLIGSRLHVHASRGQILTLDPSDLTAVRVLGTSLLATGTLASDASTAASGEAIFFGRNGQILAYDTAGKSGLGARRVASFPSITGTSIVLDPARNLAFVGDGVLRVVDVAADYALAECANGRDDDGDGQVDHAADPECRDGHDASERDDCGNGIDDDGDGHADFPADPSCASAVEASEAPNCDDGIDDDGDGLVDFGVDPGCSGWLSDDESPRCQNGLDDDGDGKIDFDGGASWNGGVPLAPADPQCPFGWRPKETPASCGLGAEVAVAGLALHRLGRRGRADRRRS